MLDVFNIATPQGCNIQTFYGSDGSGANKTWIKPRGVSNVYILLIGCAGNGDGITGGGSGAVTVWYGAAQNVPDLLYVRATVNSATATSILFLLPSGFYSTLLTAPSGNASTAGAAMTANQFAASGFFQSIAGQAGSGGNLFASSATFLSGGGAVAGNQTSNYGYTLGSVSSDRNGFFLMQPIIVGAGGMGTGKGGIGCGGGASVGSGGPGFALIASW
jgi:hypothetical protein